MEKEQERKKIKSDGKDTANTVFKKLIQKRKKTTKEITILEALTGSLNLAILSEEGFSNVEVLRFSPGKLIAISNIPTSVRQIYISNQYLEKIDLPDSIEYIDIQHNLLSKEWDISRYSLLRYLNVSYNSLRSLGTSLPESLEEIYCNHNKLRNLFLQGSPRLRVLHCEFNDKLTIHDIPDTLIDRKFPENTKMVISKDSNSSKANKTGIVQKKEEDTRDYEESIQQYFDIKSKYEEELHKLLLKQGKKRNVAKKLPPCVGCKRNVGMVFSGKEQKYRAYCGASSPCDWKILIHRGEHYSLRDTMQEMIHQLEETKENIILQKMDTLFEFISDEKSADLFKKHMELYKSNAELVDKYQSSYISLYFDTEQRETIQRKMKNIQEKEMEKRDYLENENWKEAVRIDYEEITPISNYIHHLKYPHIEMKYHPGTEEWRYLPSEILLSQNEINHGENPKVEQFGKHN